MQDIICTAGQYASHDLARKYANFTMKLSAMCWEGVVKQHTYRDFELNNVQSLQANHLIL